MRLDAATAMAWFLTTRPLVRAPILLYRWGLGRLLGNRMLLLEHIGRRSGEPRYVCLEVAERPAERTLLVGSGFGTRAQWYRNLAAHPRCHVSTGRMRRVPAMARLLDEGDSADALRRYQAAYPSGWRVLERAIEKAQGHPVETIPMVEFTLDVPEARPGSA